MPILVRRCYAIVSSESAKIGDFAEHGYTDQSGSWQYKTDDVTKEALERGDYDIELTFRELIEAMVYHPEASQCPCEDVDTHIWLSSYAEQNFQTGDGTTYSLHFSPRNPHKNEKYWRWAWRALKAQEARRNAGLWAA